MATFFEFCLHSAELSVLFIQLGIQLPRFRIPHSQLITSRLALNVVVLEKWG